VAKKLKLKSAIKHPGALTEAAKRHGVSKLQEAEKESHSSNPHIRARGILGKRLISGDLHGGNTRVRGSSMKGQALMGRNENLKSKQKFVSGPHAEK